MRLSIAIHLIGIAMWLGGLMILTRVMKICASPELDSQQPIKKMQTGMFYGCVLPGAIVASITGFYQFFAVGASVYLKQGWFHGKLTLLIVLFVATVLAWIEVARVSRGDPVRTKRVSMLHGLAALCLVGIIMLTILGRPWGHY